MEETCISRPAYISISLTLINRFSKFKIGNTFYEAPLKKAYCSAARRINLPKMYGNFNGNQYKGHKRRKINNIY